MQWAVKQLLILQCVKRAYYSANFSFNDQEVEIGTPGANKLPKLAKRQAPGPREKYKRPEAPRKTVNMNWSLDTHICAGTQ